MSVSVPNPQPAACQQCGAPLAGSGYFDAQTGLWLCQPGSACLEKARGAPASVTPWGS